jgi:hypothetical protein
VFLSHDPEENYVYVVQKVTSLNKKNMSSALRLLCNHLIAERRQSYRPKMLGYSKTNNPCMFVFNDEFFYLSNLFFIFLIIFILFKIIYEIIYFFNLTIL